MRAQSAASFGHKCLYGYLPVFASLLLLSTGQRAAAQSNEELNGSLQFNFHTPGARSLGLGRAFVARADDATAAYANPAGLLWLPQLHLVFEGRNTSFTTVHIDGGSANGVPTGIGEDAIDHPVYSRTDRDTTGLSFLAVVYPINPKWRVAAYRHELSNFKAAIDRSEGAFITLRQPGLESARGRIDPVQAEMSLDLVNYGISAAYKATESLWLGLGTSYYTYEMRSLWENFEQSSGDPLRPTEVSLGPAVFSGANSLGTRIHQGEDTDIGLIAGLLWVKPNRRWTIGLVYREGPQFEFRVERWRRLLQPDGSFLPNEPCGQFAEPPQVPCGDLDGTLSGQGTFHAPDVYAAGITYRPDYHQTWILSVEIDRITYSNLSPSIDVLVISQRRPEVSLSDFEIRDGTEYHLGVEKVFDTTSANFSARAGVWSDPSHQIRFKDRPPLSVVEVDGEVVPTNDAVRLGVRFPGGRDQLHWTAGFGIQAEHFFLDVGADFSDRTNVYSATCGIRLGGAR
jgi:long-subunit fatty acid transport protein